MLARIWRRLRGPREVRADEEVVRRELQASVPAPELEQLAAARGATLVRVHGAFIDSAKPYLPGAAIRGLDMFRVTLEFDGGRTLCFRGHGHGEGLTPCEPDDISWEGVERRDLSGLEPFGSVVGTRLRELSLLSYRGHYCHVGVRLQFESAELVFRNLWDEIEVFNGLVPEVLRPGNYAQVYEYPYDSQS
jgi:hypothetical protein